MTQDKALLVIEEITMRLANLQEKQFTPVSHNETAREITVVGVMTDHLKRLHTLRDQIGNEGNALVKQIEKLTREGRRTAELHEIVNKIFWLDLEREFPELQDKSATAVCAPWKVGWFEPDQKKLLEELLTRLAEAD